MKLIELFEDDFWKNLPRDMTLLEEILLDPNLLFEMANFREKKTGFPGVVFVSSKMASHGPRVKYYLRADKQSASFSVSIAEEPQVVANSMKYYDVAFYSKYVIEFVRNNYEALLDFWENGHDYDTDELIEFINDIKPV